jgi:3-oxoacyl-[acyl-carrier protein] reductase
MTLSLVSHYQASDFSGHTIVITGGARGIGRAIALCFAAHGGKIVIADLDARGAEEATAEIVAVGGQSAAITTDLADPAAAGKIVQFAADTFGSVNVVIHNAAFFPLTPFNEITPELLAKTFAINVGAGFGLLQAALPHFKQAGRGRMLLTSSVTGPRVAYPGLAHYAASKSGVNGFIRAAALEVAVHGVTVNGVEPGMIRTPAQDNLGGEAVMRELCKGIPLGRLGEPSDIAAAMLFLASDGAAYITGQTIIVDGGALLPES